MLEFGVIMLGFVIMVCVKNMLGCVRNKLGFVIMVCVGCVTMVCVRMRLRFVIISRPHSTLAARGDVRRDDPRHQQRDACHQS